VTFSEKARGELCARAARTRGGAAAIEEDYLQWKCVEACEGAHASRRGAILSYEECFVTAAAESARSAPRTHEIRLAQKKACRTITPLCIRREREKSARERAVMKDSSRAGAFSTGYTLS